MRRGLLDASDKLQWNWSKGAVTAKADFGQPLSTTGYLLCAYSGTNVALMASVPAAGACGGASAQPCWKDLPHGFRYADKDGLRNGITRIDLREGLRSGQAKIVVKGKGPGLALPALASLSSPVTVQLHNSVGACWAAVYTAPFNKQDASEFKDRSD